MVTVASNLDAGIPQGVDGMLRNTRPAWRGIGGRHAAQSVADIRRNTHYSRWRWQQ